MVIVSRMLVPASNMCFRRLVQHYSAILPPFFAHVQTLLLLFANFQPYSPPQKKNKSNSFLRFFAPFSYQNMENMPKIAIKLKTYPDF